jgi:dTDP-glucose 4,6-dehydratase
MGIIRKVENILVTGGAGFIGSAFVRYLLNQENFQGKVVNLDLLTYAANLKNLASCENDSRYVFVKGDILDTKLVHQICDKYFIDTIVHFAAESHVDRSIQVPYHFLKTNIEGTYSLLEVVRNKRHIHFHHISTDEVYGSLDNGGYFSEISPYRPNSPYAASKAASDHLVRSYAKTYNISTTMSHSSNNYGPCQHEEKLIPLMIKNCLEKKPLPIYGKGENIRDWIYVDDHVEAIWLILQKAKEGEVYNIGGSSEMRNLDLILLMQDILAQEMGENIESYRSLISYVQDRPGHDLRYAIDATKIKEDLGWKPRFALKEGLIQTVKWYKQEYSQTLMKEALPS